MLRALATSGPSLNDAYTLAELADDVFPCHVRLTSCYRPDCEEEIRSAWQCSAYTVDIDGERVLEASSTVPWPGSVSRTEGEAALAAVVDVVESLGRHYWLR